MPGHRGMAVVTLAGSHSFAGVGATNHGRAADSGAGMRPVRCSGPHGPAHRYALPDFGFAGEQVDERFGGYHRARV